MNIGKAAQRTGLSAKTIRYYESCSLITVSRDSNGYRQFNDVDIKQLLFIKRLRSLGFKLTDCSLLLEMIKKSDVPATGEQPQIPTELSTLFETKLRDIDHQLTKLIELRQSIQQSIQDVKTNHSGTEFIRLLNRQC